MKNLSLRFEQTRPGDRCTITDWRVFHDTTDEYGPTTEEIATIHEVHDPHGPLRFEAQWLSGDDVPLHSAGGGLVLGVASLVDVVSAIDRHYHPDARGNRETAPKVAGDDA